MKLASLLASPTQAAIPLGRGSLIRYSRPLSPAKRWHSWELTANLAGECNAGSPCTEDSHSLLGEGGRVECYQA
jgi:hypothetical protein